MSFTEVSKMTGIPRSTIRDWFKNKEYYFDKEDYSFDSIVIKYNYAYYYTLGLYLGDGSISKTERTYRLRITLDAKYNDVINYAKEQLKVLFPHNKVGTLTDVGCTILYVYSNNLKELFPQHDLKKKHERKIELSDAQIKNMNYSALLKGLFHSDGSYYRSGNYFFYNFRNKSIDIANIFRDALLKMNIHNNLTHDAHKNIYTVNIYKKEDVVKLESIVGTKGSGGETGIHDGLKIH